MPSGEKLKEAVIENGKRAFAAVASVGIIATAAFRLEANAEHSEPQVEALVITSPHSAPPTPLETLAAESEPSPTPIAPTVSMQENPQYPDKHPIEEDIKLRNWVAGSLPIKDLIALNVTPQVQNLWEEGLFVMVPSTKCAAVTHIQPLSKNKVYVDNYIFGWRDIITDYHRVIDGMFKGKVGHGDTDAADDLGHPAHEIVNRNLPDIQQAIFRITARVCDRMR